MSVPTDNTPPMEATVTLERVLYADTDKMGVVYHGTYFRWFEAGRGAFMRCRGLSYDALENDGIQLPVVEANAMYVRPARYDNVLEVATWIGDLGGAQVRFEYVISCADEVLVRGYTRHAAVGDNGRATRLPGLLKEALARPEAVQDR